MITHNYLYKVSVTSFSLHVFENIRVFLRVFEIERDTLAKNLAKTLSLYYMLGPYYPPTVFLFFIRSRNPNSRGIT